MQQCRGNAASLCQETVATKSRTEIRNERRKQDLPGYYDYPTGLANDTARGVLSSTASKRLSAMPSAICHLPSASANELALPLRLGTIPRQRLVVVLDDIADGLI